MTWTWVERPTATHPSATLTRRWRDSGSGNRYVAGLERLAVIAKVATVLRLIPASSDTVESEERHMKQC